MELEEESLLVRNSQLCILNILFPLDDDDNELFLW